MSTPPAHRIAAEREDEYGDVVRVICGCGASFVDDDAEQVSALSAHAEHVRKLALSARAKEAMDGIGWCDYSDPAAMSYATLELARIVVELARELERLRDATSES